LCLEFVCDLLSTQKSRKLVADTHELVESQVGNKVCDQVCDLDSVMEFALKRLNSTLSFYLESEAGAGQVAVRPRDYGVGHTKVEPG